MKKPPSPHASMLPFWESFGFFMLAAVIVGLIIYCAPPPGLPDGPPPPPSENESGRPLPIPANYNHPSYSDPQE